MSQAGLVGGAAREGAGRSHVDSNVSNLGVPASTETKVASDWDVWIWAWSDAAARRSPKLRPAPSGLSHNCAGRRRFMSAQLHLSNFPVWVRRKGAGLQEEARESWGRQEFLSSFSPEEQGTLPIVNPNK